ncbi:hypothetical protein [Nocardioides iriomotensis]|uniref:Uncharacterized protein n=1 Tax=Nocardioides iriomotensis TaxID=715784 RepID=A0A4Q5J7Y7_9ACTN|nr:hypothetical protein [Nocardioides iriomotensis]RYU14832.1 hypothetical protein ETU37_02265 [Nocardioides iriomotensis]
MPDNYEVKAATHFVRRGAQHTTLAQLRSTAAECRCLGGGAYGDTAGVNGWNRLREALLRRRHREELAAPLSIAPASGVKPAGKPLELGDRAIVIEELLGGYGTVVAVLALPDDEVLVDDFAGATHLLPSTAVYRPADVGYLDCGDSHGYKIDASGEPFGQIL